MKVATWNINECVGITCDLDNQKTTDIKHINNYKIDNFSDHYIIGAELNIDNPKKVRKKN